MQFNAAVKSDSTGMLKGTYQCTAAPDGLQLARKKQTVVVIPRGTAATLTGSNQVTVQTPGGTLVLAVSKFPAYQGRLAGAVAAFLRGERDLANEAEFKLEPYLLVPAVLPFGIMIVTRGGAIWGALGGGVAVACLAIAQLESIPRLGRLAIILLINVALYAGIIAMMSAAVPAGQRV
jgi:hypothetical protein